MITELRSFPGGFVRKNLLSSLFSFSAFDFQDFIAFQELLLVVSVKVGGGWLARYALLKYGNFVFQILISPDVLF